MNRRNTVLAVAVTAMLVAAGLATSALGTTAPAKRGNSAKLAVSVGTLHFSAAGRTVRATGTVTAKLTDSSGRVSTVRQKVALSAATGGSCRVLHLRLDKLSLKLLGLHADLDRVLLDITGERRGGVLGSLFCKLASAKLSTAARASTVRAINSRVNGNNGRALAFSASLTPKAAASAASTSCQVLDLVVGPLNLNLLGLVVDLKQVHLNVSAVRSEGKLGDLFCTLANDNNSGSTGASGPSS